MLLLRQNIKLVVNIYTKYIVIVIMSAGLKERHWYKKFLKMSHRGVICDRRCQRWWRHRYAPFWIGARRRFKRRQAQRKQPLAVHVRNNSRPRPSPIVSTSDNPTSSVKRPLGPVSAVRDRRLASASLKMGVTYVERASDRVRRSVRVRQ